MKTTVEVQLHPNQYNHNEGKWNITLRGEEKFISEDRARWTADSMTEALASFKAEEVLEVSVTTDDKNK